MLETKSRFAMSEDLDLLIQEKARELRPFRLRMEELRLQFINEAARFAAKWYEETAKHYVSKYSGITLTLSKEKLAKMKAKVNDLIRNVDKIVKDALSDPSIWWHLAPRKHDSFSLYEQLGNDQVGNRFPDAVDKPVRRALGELGTALEQFGYGVTTGGAFTGSYPEFWFDYPEGSGSAARPYFPHLLEWSKEMQYTLQKYDGLFKQSIRLFNEIEKLKEEKKKRQASELWDST